jgi:hypothetical protein
MANQPPLAEVKPGATQTQTPSFIEKIWARMRNSDYKPHVISILYVVFAATFIIISVLSHSATDQSFHTGFWNHAIFHLRVFHLESYDWSQVDFMHHPWILHGTEVWEFYAIGLTGIFSLLLLWEPEEKAGVVMIVFCALFIFLACTIGLLALGWHFTRTYQVLLLVMVLGLAVVDGLMFNASKTAAEYKFLQFFVDIPIFISLLMLTWYVGFPIRDSHRGFFSGALAFQFIMGCLLVMLVKAHRRILGERHWASVLLILIMWYPFGQIIVLTQQRRKAKKTAKAAAASGTGISGGGTSGGANEN